LGNFFVGRTLVRQLLSGLLTRWEQQTFAAGISSARSY
jgi:hypothetical protein